MIFGLSYISLYDIIWYLCLSISCLQTVRICASSSLYLILRIGESLEVSAQLCRDLQIVMCNVDHTDDRRSDPFPFQVANWWNPFHCANRWHTSRDHVRHGPVSSCKIGWFLSESIAAREHAQERPHQAVPSSVSSLAWRLDFWDKHDITVVSAMIYLTKVFWLYI